MNLQTILKDYNCRKGKYYPYEIDTPIGTLQVSLRGEHFATNFIDREQKAKLIQGHWKNNTFVSSDEDIVNHIESIFKDINRYKAALKTGNFNYKTI